MKNFFKLKINKKQRLADDTNQVEQSTNQQGTNIQNGNSTIQNGSSGSNQHVDKKPDPQLLSQSLQGSNTGNCTQGEHSVQQMSKDNKKSVELDLGFFKLITKNTGGEGNSPITIYEEIYGKDKTLVDCGVCGATLELTKDLVHDLIIGQHELMEKFMRRIINENMEEMCKATKSGN